MTTNRPRLADVNVTPMNFRAGDKLLVRVYVDYTKSEMERIKRMVERWAGDVVEVLVINATKVEVSVERGG